MRLTPGQTRIAVVLAERQDWTHLPDLARQAERSRSSVYHQLLRLVRYGVVEKSLAGWRLAPDLLVSRTGIVYRQLWLLDVEAA